MKKCFICGKEVQCGEIIDLNCWKKIDDELSLYKLTLEKCARLLGGCPPLWALPQRCDIGNDCVNCIIKSSIAIAKKELSILNSVSDGEKK